MTYLTRITTLLARWRAAVDEALPMSDERQALAEAAVAAAAGRQDEDIVAWATRLAVSSTKIDD